MILRSTDNGRTWSASFLDPSEPLISEEGRGTIFYDFGIYIAADTRQISPTSFRQYIRVSNQTIFGPWTTVVNDLISDTTVDKSPYNLNRINYGNGRFFVVGYRGGYTVGYGSVMNPASWQTLNAAFPDSPLALSQLDYTWYGVAYGDLKWVFLGGETPNTVWYFEDTSGFTDSKSQPTVYQPVSSPSTSIVGWNGLLYANGYFIAYSYNLDSLYNVMRSSDGIRWAIVQSTAFMPLFAAAAGNSSFMFTIDTGKLNSPISSTLNIFSIAGLYV
jgi:hypothetical protein